MLDSSHDGKKPRSTRQPTTPTKMTWKTVLVSPRFLAAVILVQLCALLLVAYALSIGSEVSFDKQTGLIIKPRAELERIRILEQQIAELQKSTVKKEEYDDIFTQLDDLRKTTINIGMLPESLQFDKPDQIVLEIKRMLEQTRESVGDVALSLAIVGKELGLSSIIDTNTTQTKSTIYTNFHIQRVLHAIGHYEGPLDGARDPTYRAVISFQQSKGLKADGKLGKKTWAAVREQWSEVEKQK